jgi:hypothetical protein
VALVSEPDATGLVWHSIIDAELPEETATGHGHHLGLHHHGAQSDDTGAPRTDESPATPGSGH